MESRDIVQKVGAGKLLIWIIVGAALLRLLKINESLSIDEFLTIRDYISQGFSAIFLTYREPNNHILNSLLARISILIFGPHNWSYKLPSFLLAVWAVFLQYRLGQLWFDQETALAASALLGGSFFHILFSTQARGYSGMVTTTLLALVLFTLAWRENKNRHWLGLGAALVLGSFFHPFVIFPYLGCLLCGIYLYRGKWREPAAGKFLFTFGGAAAIVSLLYLPLWGQMADIYRYRTGYDFVSKLFLRFVAGYLGAGPLFTPATLVYLAFFLLGLWYLKGWDRRVGIVLFFIIPVVLLKYVIQPIWLFTRFFIFLLPLYLLVVANGVKNTFHHRLWVGILILMLLNVPVLSKYYSTELLPSADVVKYIRDRLRIDEWIVGNGFTRLVFYYYPDRKGRQTWFENVKGNGAAAFMKKHEYKGIWFINAVLHDRFSDSGFSFRLKVKEPKYMQVGGRGFAFQESFRGIHPLGKTFMVYYSPPVSRIIREFTHAPAGR